MLSKKVLMQIYMLSISALVLAQTEFKGRVVDEAGNSVAGALIQASSQNTVGISDVNGYFTYDIMPSSVIPVVSRGIEHNNGMHVWVDRTGLKCSIYNKGYYSIQLLTLQGKNVYSHRQYFDLSGTLLLFASGLPFSQGIYIANIQTPDGNFRAKLIKFHNEFQVAKIYPGRHIDHRLPGYSKTSALLSDTIKVSAVEYFDKKYPIDPGITGTTEMGNVVLTPVSTTSGATGPDGVIEVGTITILGVERVIYGDLQNGSIVSKFFYDENNNKVDLITYFNDLRRIIKENCGNFGLALCTDFHNYIDTSEAIEVVIYFDYQIPDTLNKPTALQMIPIQDTAYARGSVNLQNVIGPNNLERIGGVQGQAALSCNTLTKLKYVPFISDIELKNPPPPPPAVFEYPVSMLLIGEWNSVGQYLVGEGDLLDRKIMFLNNGTYNQQDEVFNGCPGGYGNYKGSFACPAWHSYSLADSGTYSCSFDTLSFMNASSKTVNYKIFNLTSDSMTISDTLFSFIKFAKAK